MLKSIKDKYFKFLEEKFICYDFEAIDRPIEDYAEFLKSSGLFDLISNRKIKNLVDYAIGIEVGLDSNSRKNRSGKIMEDVVEEFFKLAGIPYQTQMKYKDMMNNMKLICVQSENPPKSLILYLEALKIMN